MEKTRVALIGCRGHWGYALNGLKQLGSECEVVGISTGCEDDPQKMAEIAKEFLSGTPEIFKDYRKLLDSGVDVAVIDGPFELHAEMCIEALKRKIHVFCEKPIALELNDLAEIEKYYAAVAGDVKLISMVGLRFEPAFATAHKAVAAGIVGKVKMVSARKSYKLGERPDFYRHRESFGGTMPWVGSHALDWIQWFGGAPFDKIFAVHNSDDNRGHGDLEMSAVCCFELANKVIGSATIDYLRPQSAPTHGDDRVRVAGTDGVIEVAGGEVKLINADGEKILPLEKAPGLFYNFIRSIRYGEACWTNAAETFELTRACLAARNFADAL